MKNKLLKALLSAAIALGLWLYVVTFVSPSSDSHYYGIPVTLQGEAMLNDRGLMITTTETPKVSLHLEGNRTNLNKLNSSNITLSADVSKIGKPGTHTLTFTPVYPGDVPNNSITVLSQSPGEITIQVENRITKELPVEIRYLGALPEGYMADKENVVLSNETVNISGPQSVVDRIAMARIDVNLDQRVESFSENLTYALCNSKGEPVDAKLITTDVESVAMTLKVLRVKEIDLKVNVIAGGGASVDNTDIVIAPQSILVSGSGSLLEGLESLDLGTINLGEVLENQELTYTIRLPEGVTNETGVTEATVTVKLPKLVTRKIKVTNFQAINPPEGLREKVITQRLEITIRGPKKAVESIDASKVVAQIDLSNQQAGTAKVKAQFIIGNESVGAVGSYIVTAELK